MPHLRSYGSKILRKDQIFCVRSYVLNVRRIVFSEYANEPSASGSSGRKPRLVPMKCCFKAPCWDVAFGGIWREISAPEGWKYCHSSCGEHQLFNLSDDPGERVNLAKQGGKTEVIDDLRARLRRRMEQYADPLSERWTFEGVCAVFCFR